MKHPWRRVLAPGVSSRSLLLASVATLALFAPAWADVTLKEKTVSSGLMGFGSGTSERTLVIAGDKGRSDDVFTYTGRFKTLAGGGKPRASATITRLDRELVWSLDPEHRQYTEMTFAEMREAFEKGMTEAQAEMKKPENARARDVEVDTKVDVKRTGRHEKVNGYNAEQVIITLTATPKDKESGQAAGAYTITMDQWLSNEVPASAELTAYYKRFAEKLGMDPQMQRMASGMMSQYGSGMKQLAEKMKEVRGYPVRSTMTMGMGQALTPEQKAQLDKARADDRKAREEQREKQSAKDDAEANESAAGSLAGGSVGGAVGGLLGHRFGKAAQKKAESGEASGAADGGAPSGGMSVTTDLVSITAGAAGAKFEVPSDYKKVERRKH